MTIQLELPPELEKRLRFEAKRRGLPVDAVTVQLLETHLPPDGQRTKVDDWLNKYESELDSMSEQDFAANRKVLQAIDDERPAHAKIFANILKDQAS